MVTITHSQTLWSEDLIELGQTSKILITYDGAGSSLLISDPEENNLLTALLSTTDISNASFVPLHVSSGQGLSQVGFNGETRALDRATILRLCEAASEVSKSEATYFNRSGFFGDLTNVLALNKDGVDYVFVTDRINGGIVSLRADIQGNLVELSSVVDTGSTNVANISSLVSVAFSATTFVIGASQTENALNVFQVGLDGVLTLVSSLNSNTLLPVDRPTDLDIVKSGNAAFVLMAAYGSSSLTVFELTAQGDLTFVSQVVDSLGTRFSGANSVDSIEFDGQTFVAIAGNDGGLSIFRLLPNGQLVALDTVVDTSLMALQNIQQVEFAIVAGELELWAFAIGDGGLTRLKLDLGSLGTTVTGQNGTVGNDILTFSGTGQTLNGYAGDDVLIGSIGNDTMIGGAGQDIFVFSENGGNDVVQDFNFQEDKIDLTAFKGIKSLSDVSIAVTQTQLVMSYQDQIWTIQFGAYSGPTFSQLTDSITFSTNRVFVEAQQAVTPNVIVGDNAANDISGTPGNDHIQGYGGNDIFHWSEGSDLFDGAIGIDMVSYLNANQSITVNLADNTEQAGAAVGDTYVSIESIVGTAFSDRITGDSGTNRLTGGGGNDQLFGAGGDDVLSGGDGADTLDGGTGVDLVDYGKSTQSLYVDLLIGNVNTGQEAQGDIFVSIENLRGGKAADDLRGDHNDNMIIGGLGNDFIMGRDGQDILIGSLGHDILVGGVGNDILSGGIGNDRLLGQSGNDRLVGGAGNDKLIDFEGKNSMIGGEGDDLIYDGGGDSILYGGGGNDRLIGSRGHDRLYGAAGDDTLNGGDGNDFLVGDQGRDYLVGGNGWDRFVFREDTGNDTVADFTAGQDRLFISSTLAQGALDANEIVNQYATVTGSNTILDFGGGNKITLIDFTDLNSLPDMIYVIA